MATTTATTGIPMAETKTLYPTTGKKDLNSTDFMKLFITQLQYQDPSKPMDTYQMSSQLAQFSSMEATMKMSSNMEKLVTYQTSQSNMQLLSMLDKTVLAKGNTIGVTNGAASTSEFDLSGKSVTCVIEVYNNANQLVQKIDKGALSPGTYEFAWDGKDKNGKTVADGIYSYLVKAKDITGDALQVDSRMSGKVTGLSFPGGRATLTMNNNSNLSMDDVLEIR